MENLKKLYIFIEIIINIKYINILSTFLADMLLFILFPTRPPIIPPKTITINVSILNSGILLLIKVLKKLAICENIIIYIEFAVAIFVSIEKKYDNITKFIGPPPIPRKAEINPKTSPIKIHKKEFLTFIVSIFYVFLTYIKVAIVIITSIKACTAPTLLSLLNNTLNF